MFRWPRLMNVISLQSRIGDEFLKQSVDWQGIDFSTRRASLKILTSPWLKEFDSLIASAEKRLRIAAPYFSEGTIRAILEYCKSTVDLQFIFRLSSEGVRSGSQSAKAVAWLMSKSGCRIRIAANLHAKVIIADDRAAIVTSSNLTHRGLCQNIELGALLEERKAVKVVSAEFDNWFDNLEEPDSKRLQELCSLPKRKFSGANDRALGKNIPLQSTRKAEIKMDSTYGWILVHAEKMYPDGGHTTPEDELDDLWRGVPLLWHWTRHRPLKEGKRYRLLFAWEGKIFGEGDADVTHAISSARKKDGFSFAFLLTRYEKAHTPVPLTKITELKHYHDLIKLDKQMRSRFLELSR